MKTSIGKGRFHLWFSDYKKFIKAFAVFYLGKLKKRCWVIISSEDNLIVVQPSVSTYGLNILLFKAGNIENFQKTKILDLFKKEGMEIIKADSIRRPAGAQGFTVFFKKPGNFIKALDVFYLLKKEPRCRVIIPKKGTLIVQPDRSTPELNILVLEGFELLVGKDLEKIKTKISSLEIIECDVSESLPITVNFQ